MIKGTTVDLTDGLMGNDASDKNNGGIQRTQKSVKRDQTRGARGLYRDSSSGDENSEDERKQIPTTQSKTGGSETRASTKGLLHKGGIRKSQSGGAREEDFENRGGGRAMAADKKRTLEAHAPTERHEKRRNHNGCDVTSTNGSNHGTNPVSGGIGEEDRWGARGRGRACASTSGGGETVKTVVAVASASISGGGASVKTVAAAASASTSSRGANVKTAVTAVSASTRGRGASVRTAAAAALRALAAEEQVQRLRRQWHLRAPLRPPAAEEPL